jgi:mRNA-degrading endonuclease toxin of MazEF toxin-antitoxin module
VGEEKKAEAHLVGVLRHGAFTPPMLSKTSTRLALFKVLLDQIRTVDESRLGSRIGVLTAERLGAVNRAIRLSLAA